MNSNLEERIIMKKKITKTIVAAITALMTAGALVGCGSNTDTNADANTSTETSDNATEQTSGNEAEAEGEGEAEANTDLSGTISMAGSTSMEKLCEAMKESFMAEYPDITVTSEYTGSSAGIESLVQGSVDIGNSSRALEESEIEGGAVENIVAIDGIAVITDKENTVTDLTTDQLKQIYTGEVKNWSELGGKDEAIVVIGREAGSGTRGAFEELLEIEDACAYAQELDSTGGVLAKVASTPGAIGYVSLDVVDDTVTSMKLDGVEATEENIVAGDYSLSRPFVMATMGEISEQNELVQEWFSYIESEAGQEVITAIGLILPN
jgi:phosphate transport system substrate-binding protein